MRNEGFLKHIPNFNQNHIRNLCRGGRQCRLERERSWLEAPVEFLSVAILFTAALHGFARTKMFAEGVDARREYGSPFNTKAW